MLRGEMPANLYWIEVPACRSITSVAMPKRASSAAAVSPDNPAPMTATSTLRDMVGSFSLDRPFANYLNIFKY
jgi:hypothetical protein